MKDSPVGEVACQKQDGGLCGIDTLQSPSHAVRVTAPFTQGGLWMAYLKEPGATDRAGLQVKYYTPAFAVRIFSASE